MTKEWHPDYPDWLKETRCTPCRMPTTEGGKDRILPYTPVKCRNCRFAKISKCTDCGVEIRHCIRRPQNSPPSTEIDKLRKCVLYFEKDY